MFGSQAILGTFDVADLPASAVRSLEVDLAVVGDDDAATMADLIEGAIGEGSRFNETFGIYAQGTNLDFARLPDGWWPRRRTIEVDCYGRTVDAHFLDAHDLWISKAVVGREKDIVYCADLLAAGAVEQPTLEERLELVPHLSEAERHRALAAIAAGHAAQPIADRRAMQRDQEGERRDDRPGDDP